MVNREIKTVFFFSGPPKPLACVTDDLEQKVNTLYPKALDGFLIVLSKDGDIIYISESVARYLGLQQVRHPLIPTTAHPPIPSRCLLSCQPRVTVM